MYSASLQVTLVGAPLLCCYSWFGDCLRLPATVCEGAPDPLLLEVRRARVVLPCSSGKLRVAGYYVVTDWPFGGNLAALLATTVGYCSDECGPNESTTCWPFKLLPQFRS